MMVSFLIAAHNEVATIREVLDRIRALPLDAQIVAVDDGSTDGTAEAIESWREEHGAVVLLRQGHRGKGAAVRHAIEAADGEIAVIQDADMEYDPADVPALIEPIERGADPVARSGAEFDTPLAWAALGSQAWREQGRDYVQVAELLLGAGAELEPRFAEVAEGPLAARLRPPGAGGAPARGRGRPSRRRAR